MIDTNRTIKSRYTKNTKDLRRRDVKRKAKGREKPKSHKREKEQEQRKRKNKGREREQTRLYTNASQIFILLL